jgi:hypothetical protein
MCGKFTNWPSRRGNQKSAAIAVPQVTRFHDFETQRAKFNRIVAIRAASLTNKGFPQIGYRAQSKPVQDEPPKLAPNLLDFSQLKVGHHA